MEVPLPNDVSLSLINVSMFLYWEKFSKNGRLFLMTSFTDAGGFLYVGKSLVSMLHVCYLGTIVMSYTMFFREEICNFDVLH